MSTVPKRICLVAACLCVILALSGTAGARPVAVPNGGWPAVELISPVYGTAAILALGTDLPAVAQANGLSTSELSARLATDKHLGVDRSGHLFFADSTLPPAPAGSAVSGAAEASVALAPLQDTFALHSRPGAKQIIYLDFDGHTLSGTAWNVYKTSNGGRDIICPPWDIDGQPTVFGDTERARIQQVWQRVSEDYAPFDVDVTTEYTGEAAITRSGTIDEYFGMRVLISPISSAFGSYGGIAYIGVFDRVGDYYKPALVFPENLQNGEKYIAEASSHENGHTLGLLHDGRGTTEAYYQGHGSGETGWAPIMGNGYYKNLTQWSKGEYTGANNQEDDLAIITGHGIGYRLDDHGNSRATATPLPAGTSPSMGGVIGATGDADVFSLDAGAGPLTLAASPAVLGANLDILLELRRSDGTLLNADNPAGLLAATVSTTVPAGTYYVTVTGTGKGDASTGYSTYGDLGAYTLSATVVGAVIQKPPVAVAVATPTSGLAPLEVTFNGSGSSDPDGSITGHSWSFGDGTTGSGATVTHTYSAAGSYAAVLTVTDNDGLTAVATVSVTVSAAATNQPPTAVATATPSSGYTPLSVVLDGSGSRDPDGSIASYGWTFGDGTTGSGVRVTHVYSKIGTYAAVLTVTDNKGAKATASTQIVVTGNPAKVLRVTSISLTSTRVSGRNVVKATVKVTDLNGLGASGVTVKGTWSGLITGTTSRATTTGGTVLLTSSAFTKTGVVTFSIAGLTKSGFSYDATKNLVTSASITIK